MPSEKGTSDDHSNGYYRNPNNASFHKERRFDFREKPVFQRAPTPPRLPMELCWQYERPNHEVLNLARLSFLPYKTNEIDDHENAGRLG